VKPNLATGKPVTVGPSPDRKDGWYARIAVDGRADDAGRHWASEGAAPQWLQVDLEKIRPIDFINVITYWDGSRYLWVAKTSSGRMGLIVGALCQRFFATHELPLYRLWDL
jgi:hypothetical protein